MQVNGQLEALALHLWQKRLWYQLYKSRHPGKDKSFCPCQKSNPQLYGP